MGSATETFTATDNASPPNFDSGSFHVEVKDVEDPDMTPVPADIIVNTAPGLCTAVATFATPTATDNCPNATIDLTAGKVSGSTFGLGVTAQTFTATDASGNSLSDIFHVVVSDNENPGITGLPSSSTHGNDAGQCGANVNYAAPTPTDNCPGATVALTSGPSSGSFFGVGNTDVTFTATDTAGNTGSGTFTVTVTDDEDPLITGLPSDDTQPNDPGQCSAAVTYTAPGVTDNCPGATIELTSGPVSGASFPVGDTDVTFTATDGAGNFVVVGFTVTVLDVEDPGVTSLTPVTQSTDPGQCAAAVTYAAPTPTDNCPGVVMSLTSGPSSGSVFTVGDTDVTFTATDAAGNTGSGTFTVTVNDDEVPGVTGLTPVTQSNDPGQCAAAVTYAAPTPTDNCPGATVALTSGPSSGSVFTVGDTDVTFTATDAAGNTGSGTFTVTVNDDESPGITGLPSSSTHGNDAGQCGANVNYAAPGATDNCPGATVALTSGLSSGSFFGLGNTDVTFTATDTAGNTGSGTFTVTVTDDEDPGVTSLTPVTQSTDPGQCAAAVTYAAPTPTDNCPGATVALTSGPSSGSVFTVGDTDVTFTATDAAGNTGSGTFTVTVNDDEVPGVTGLTPVTQSNDPGQCAAAVTYAAPTPTDNCPGVVMSLTSGPSSGSVFTVGDTDVTFTATDTAGNTGSGTFTVTVNDDESPGITGLPSSSTHGNDAGQCGANVNYAAPGATDNCPGATVALTSGLSSGSFFGLGNTDVTFTATDTAGNTGSGTFTVTVTDDEVPGVTSLTPVTQSTDPGQCTAAVTYAAPTPTDNCPGATVALTSGPSSGSVFTVGDTDVTFTATDAAGNTGSGTFTVTVNDDEVPGVTGLTPVTQSNDPGQCTATVTYAAPTPTDNCPGVVMSLTSGPSSGSVFTVGDTDVTFTATDAAGNTGSGTFTVTVNDDEDPGVTSLTPVTQSNDPGQCAAAVTYAAPTPTDNCPGVVMSLTSGPSSGSVFTVGDTDVTFTATDTAGNTGSGTFTVTVNDDEVPGFTGLTPVTQSNDPGQCTAAVTYAAPSPTDNCPGVVMSLTSGPSSGSVFTVGDTDVTFTATDTAGNTGSGTFTVTVNDNESPGIAGLPADITASNIAGTCAAAVTYAAPTPTDNCPGATIALTSGPSSGASFSVGMTDVTFTAADGAGNTGSGTFTVTVTDNEPPALEVEDIEVESCSPTVVTFSPTATDNCPGVQVSCTPASGSEFPVGETEVICTAADGAGGQTQASFDVEVECVANDGPGDGTTQAPTYYRKNRGNTVHRHFKNIRKNIRHHIKKWLHGQ